MRRRELLAVALSSGVRLAAAAPTSPVVLELFTSQGCLSCPPADALLGQLARRPEVIALAWHVDYWDHLGWRDRFASRAATERQRAYARQLGIEVFTPALVVDGRFVVVGSQRDAVEAAIETAGSLSVPVTISETTGGAAIGIGPATEPVRALRILYDQAHDTGVEAGENNGARLREYRIVREAETLGDWESGARRFVVRPRGPGQGLAILIQSADLRVVGAGDLRPT